MGNTLSLPTLKALADATADYGGGRLLEPLSAVTILSFAAFLSQRQFWTGEGLELTLSELDEIDALIGTLVNDVMVGGESVMDYELIGQAFAINPTSFLAVDNLDSSDYLRYKVFVTGARTNKAINWVDHVLMNFNDDTTNANYSSISEFNVAGVSQHFQSIGSEPGVKQVFSATAVAASNGVFGSSETTIFNVKEGEFTNVNFAANVGGYVINQIARTSGTGLYKSEDEITKITIRPSLGTQFLMDRASPVLPSNLRMTVYGIR